MLFLAAKLGRSSIALVALVAFVTPVTHPASVGSASLSAAGGSKKGVASAKYLFRDPGKLRALNVSWTYGWSPYVPPSTPGLDVVPMVWGTHSVTTGTIRTLAKGRAARRYGTLLGFNEPDSPKQASMTPRSAAALWPRLESTGLRLGSPAPADPNDGWLANFMSLARSRHLRVDFIALHFYVDFTSPDAVSRVVATLRTIYARYKRPIWITEIGTVDIRPWGEDMASPPSTSAAAAFMTATASALDALPFIERYAWFSDNVWSTPQYRTSSLYDGAGHLTTLGQRYRAIK